MEKKVLKISVIASIIVLLIILVILLLIITNVNKEKNNTIEPKIVSNEEEKTKKIYDKSVYTEKNGVFYTSSGEPAEGIDFQYNDIPDEVLKYIKDTKAFYATMRTYAFSYGFSKKANSATYSRYEYQETTNRLAIEFLLNDESKTKFVAIVDLKNNTIQISY